MTIELQEFLFHEEPDRKLLLRYKAAESVEYVVQVYRNHSFELVEHTIAAYLDYAKIGVQFEYSGYDDSFSFAQVNQDADLLIIWVDATRYQLTDAGAFLTERVETLRRKSNKPILVVPYGVEISIELPGVTVLDWEPVKKKLNGQIEDRRMQATTGTPLGGKTLMELSKVLGLWYIPALLHPAVKAVVVDLDNTLYSGVLGEDGVQGVVLTPGHYALQERLRRLSEQGYFLCVASKNNLQDVKELLHRRKDFPLREKNFTKICASWASKSQSIQDIADFLNIDSGNMLVVDDNIGELEALKMNFPSIKRILAKEDAYETERVLEYYPGLFRVGPPCREDALRSNDVQSNEKRRALRQELSQEDYIRSLKIQLRFDCNMDSQIQRISELSNKTNQFIFNYCRYTPGEVKTRMDNGAYMIVTVSLSDRISDSGQRGQPHIFVPRLL